MKRARAVLWVVLLAGGALAAYVWLVPSDARRIRKVLLEAAEAASWTPADGGLNKLAGVGKVASLCTPEVEIFLEGPSGGPVRAIRGSEELQSTMIAARTLGASLQLELRDIDAELDDDRTQATAQFVAVARGGGGPEDPVVQEVRARLRKVDGGWKIARIEPVRGFGM